MQIRRYVVLNPFSIGTPNSSQPIFEDDDDDVIVLPNEEPSVTEIVDDDDEDEYVRAM